MNFFRKLFNSSSEYNWPGDVSFGRYSDAFKADAKYDAWDKAMELFEKGNYLDSYKLFFYYLLDEKENNVSTELADGKLKFEVLQGSQVIRGVIADPVIKAEARVARTSGLSIGMLRKMLELNFTLKYSRYALDDEENLVLLFDSFLLDGSPYKMYYALKEIAVSADKQDDLLIKEFDTLTPVNGEHIRPYPEEQAKIRLGYLRNEIQSALENYDNGKLNKDQYSGAYGYAFLELAYRLDYLVKPEGSVTEFLEEIHKVYFEAGDRPGIEKNNEVYSIYEKTMALSDDQIIAGLYDVPSTFGITSPATHEQLVGVIDSELRHMDWFAENNNIRLALAFPSYIAGFALFNYSFEPALRFLLHLYYHIMNPEYFKALGFSSWFLDQDSGQVDKWELASVLEGWIEEYRPRYPRLRFDIRDLNFSNHAAFAKSYFLMIRGLDFTKAS